MTSPVNVAGPPQPPVAPAPNPTPQLPPVGPPGPVPGPPGNKPKRNRNKPCPPVNPVVDPLVQLEALKEVERFKLGIWLVKFTMRVMTALVFFIMAMYGYIAIETKTLPDMTLVGSIFTHLKEVVVVIVESQQK